MPNLLKVRLSLKGRPIRTYTFNKKDVSIGRDPSSDIFLDNTGISRNHARIERTPGGYVLEDLGSANGTFLNEQAIRKDFLGHDDVVTIGKFALWVGVETDRREKGNLLGGASAPGMMEGTMVLDPDSLAAMQRKARADAPLAADPPERRAATAPEAPAGLSRAACTAVGAAAFAAGLFVGAAGAFLLWG